MQSPSKGKKRDRQGTTSLDGSPRSTPPIKKPKRAETRQCPICSEHIPTRLLAAHCALENERVEEIIRAIGSLDVVADSDDGVQFSRARRSAARARKAFTNGTIDSTDETEKSIRSIKRRRKQRHVKLREMIRYEDEIAAVMENSTGSTCPICLTIIQGDPDVIDAHVDSCLLHAARLQEEQALAIIEGDNSGPSILRVTDGVDLTASGFYVRNNNQQDVEDEIDVDGDDEDVFGHAQFTEVDILSGTFSNGAEAPPVDGVHVDLVNADGSSRLHRNTDGNDILKRRSTDDITHSVDARVGQATITSEINIVVMNARQQGNERALIQALEDKIKLLESTRMSSSTSSLCRICLDPYTEPTVSTQCWHTCCRECWLRCLSTRLCPICKRITSAENLRRVYL